MLAVLGAVAAGSVGADPAPPPGTRPALEWSVGVSRIFDEGTQPMRYGAEYFWHPVGRWSLTPGVGLACADGGSNFVFLDLRKDFRIDPRWTLSINLGGGLFHEDGGLDLGSEVEFRSGIALGRRFGERVRIGVAFFHVSNGKLAEKNPGTEAVDLLFNVGLGKPAGG